MKITNIEEEYFNIYIVTFKPNWFEKLLGYKEKVKRYKKTWSTYVFGGGNVYLNEEGYRLGNGNWIGRKLDAHGNKF